MELALCLCLVTQSCLTLCDLIDCSLPGSSVQGDSPGKNIGVGCHALFPAIFPTQGSNPGLLHCRQILYRLSHQVFLSRATFILSTLLGRMLKLNIKKLRSWLPVSSLHSKQMGKQWKQWQAWFSWAPKSLQMVTAVMKLKDTCSLEENRWQI